MTEPSSDLLELPTREFRIWWYYHGHSELLLRAGRFSYGRKPTFSTRVDVLFKNVDAYELPVSMSGLLVSAGAPEQLETIRRTTGGWSATGQKLFLTRGAEWAGYIVAGAMFVSDDGGGDDEPSRLGDADIVFRAGDFD